MHAALLRLPDARWTERVPQWPGFDGSGGFELDWTGGLIHTHEFCHDVSRHKAGYTLAISQPASRAVPPDATFWFGCYDGFCSGCAKGINPQVADAKRQAYVRSLFLAHPPMAHIDFEEVCVAVRQRVELSERAMLQRMFGTDAVHYSTLALALHIQK